MRNLLTNVPIVPDGTWLAKTKGLRPLVGALLAGGISERELESRLPFLGVLLKTEDDLARVLSR